MEIKNVLSIIKHIEKKEDKNKILDKYNHEIDLCLESMEFFISEEDKIYLLKETKFNWKAGEKLVRYYLKNEERILFVLKKCKYHEKVCDAAIPFFKVRESDNNLLSAIEKVGDNQNFINAVGRFVEEGQVEKQEV